MLALFLGEFHRLTWHKRGAILGLGLLTAFIMNCARALFLAWISHRYGQAESLHGWHDPAGALVLVVTFIVLGGVTALWSRPLTKLNLAGERLPSRRLHLGWTISVAVWILALETTARIWYHFHESRFNQTANFRIQWPKQGPEFRLSQLPPETRELLRYNEGQTGYFQRPDGRYWVVHFFQWSAGKEVDEPSWHLPNICGPAHGWLLSSGPDMIVLEANQIRLPILAYEFHKQGLAGFVFRCHWQHRFQDKPEENYAAYGRLRAVWEGRRPLGMYVLQISGLGFEKSSQAIGDLKTLLQEIIQPSRG
jgi:exosortase/archaeosortase family protein